MEPSPSEKNKSEVPKHRLAPALSLTASRSMVDSRPSQGLQNIQDPVSTPSNCRLRPQNVVPQSSAPIRRQIAVPKSTNFHDDWEPRFQPVAKCDFCSQRKLPILQSCKSCRMTICQACCELKHAEAHIRQAELERLGGEVHRSDKMRLWATFAIEQCHVLDPSTTSWEVPDKAKPARANKTGTGRGKAAAASRSRRQGARSGRRRQAVPQETPSPILYSEERIEATPSSARRVEEEEPTSCLADDEDGNRVILDQTGAPPGHGTKRRASLVSPSAAEAQEAASILAGWSTSPSQSARKRLRSSQVEEAGTPRLRPQLRSPPPTLPPLSSIYPAWASAEVAGRSPFGASLPQQYAFGRGQGHSGHHRHPSDLGSYRVSQSPHQSVCRESPRLAASPFARHRTPSYHQDLDGLRPRYRPNAAHNVVYREEEAPPHPVFRTDRQAPAHSPRVRILRQHQPESSPSAEPSSNTRTHPDTSLSAPCDIQTLGLALQQRALARHTAQPQVPLGHCLRNEVHHLWSGRSTQLRSTASINYTGTTTEQAFYALLAATYYACARLDLASCNAARDWLCESERALAEAGVLVPVRVMAMGGFMSVEEA